MGIGIAALFRRDGHPLLWVVRGAFYTAIGITVVAVQRRRISR
ncbi:hypothetical protein [Streptomyces sp. NTH33]|nr:hypothetical protein [Streptomyces sp. NTH33]